MARKRKSSLGRNTARQKRNRARRINETVDQTEARLQNQSVRNNDRR